MKKTEVKTIFFDNDGVLVDTEKCYFEANQRALTDLGISMSLGDYQKYFLRSSRGIHAILGDAPKAFLEDFRKKRKQYHMELLAEKPIAIPGVDRILPLLSKHFRIGVVTSSEKEPFERIHKRTGFAPYFDFVICREDVKFSKPHPEPYLKALAFAGCAPEHCLVIEDAERGLRAALAAGLCCWVIPGPMACGGSFSGAGRILGSLEEAASLLL
ncbi:HAD superfamily hydrolase (TIGR01509 family) [Desulfobotulus alkaliphilus]|uniref:phosphoglycolate phosphatase n=1 Tax=Desulfobotulus alkaliphilus TaxID=622671 RepID=A0A562S392_9BACT|nr:HAD family phosphatase [Desulfobotulus alkaliphilus]TWI75673.1 HAD superfamily hydrolase (TIGR01509 family) [Desulfobotulus alkaliphilus]